jgi:hypothetical protein
LVQEITSEGSDPFENREAGAGFQDEKGDYLLQEEPNDDCRPNE